MVSGSSDMDSNRSILERRRALTSEMRPPMVWLTEVGILIFQPGVTSTLILTVASSNMPEASRMEAGVGASSSLEVKTMVVSTLGCREASWG